jgi:uncharacterized protein YcfL
MYKLTLVLLSFSILVACKSHEVGNSYMHEKHQPSEKIAKEGKKAEKVVRKVFLKQQKKNKNNIKKKGRLWGDKKNKYTFN